MDCAGMVVGTVIGAGIFLVPSLIARELPSPRLIVAVWAVSGLLSFFGALAYAELAAMMPATGGQYVYLREAWGPLWAFLSGWCYFLIVVSGAIAWLAVSFPLILSYFLPIPPLAGRAISLGLIALLTCVNYTGVKAGAAVQNLFMVLKVAALLALIASAFLFGHPTPHNSPAPFSGFRMSHFGIAMIAALTAYDGWVSASFIAGEVKRPQRNVPLAMALGMVALIALYVTANRSFLRVLSVGEIAGSSHVAAAAARKTMGGAGGAFVAVSILLSVVGSANGWILGGPRLFFAQAADGLFFSAFARIHPRFQTPYVSLIFTALAASVVTLVGSFESLLTYAMLMSWIFYAMTVIGLILLRVKHPDYSRPYKMWGYPVTPVLFAGIAIWFAVNAILERPAPAAVSLLLILAGVPVYYLWRRGVQRSPKKAETRTEKPGSRSGPSSV